MGQGGENIKKRMGGGKNRVTKEGRKRKKSNREINKEEREGAERGTGRRKRDGE